MLIQGIGKKEARVRGSKAPGLVRVKSSLKVS